MNAAVIVVCTYGLQRRRTGEPNAVGSSRTPYIKRCSLSGRLRLGPETENKHPIGVHS